MHSATHEIEIEAVGSLFSPEVIVVAVVVWLLVATGIAGRVMQYLEELPHLRAATAILGSPRRPAGLHRDHQVLARWTARRPVPITPLTGTRVPTVSRP